MNTYPAVSTACVHRYALVLVSLAFLFLLRVIGQGLVAFAHIHFLPPMEAWQSGLMSYSQLLAAQIVIIILYGKVCLDFVRGNGWFVIQRERLGLWLLRFGLMYLGAMIIRYVIRMALYPAERWTGGCIPIFFHCVLAVFLLVLGWYHWSSRGRTAVERRPWHRRLPSVIGVICLTVCMAAWIAFQSMPSYLYHDRQHLSVLVLPIIPANDGE